VAAEEAGVVVAEAVAAAEGGGDKQH